MQAGTAESAIRLKIVYVNFESSKIVYVNFEAATARVEVEGGKGKRKEIKQTVLSSPPKILSMQITFLCMPPPPKKQAGKWKMWIFKNCLRQLWKTQVSRAGGGRGEIVNIQIKFYIAT